MEHVRVAFSDAEFDQAVHGDSSLAERGDLEIIMKDEGTKSGKPIAVITFSVLLPDGSSARAQAVTTVNALSMALSAIEGRYGPNSRKPW